MGLCFPLPVSSSLDRTRLWGCFLAATQPLTSPGQHRSPLVVLSQLLLKLHPPGGQLVPVRLPHFMRNLKGWRIKG